MKSYISAVAGLLMATTGSAALAQSEPMSWSGPYVGGQIGYGFQSPDGNEAVQFDTDRNGSFNDTVRNLAGANAFSPGFCGGAATGNTPGSGCNDDKDGLSWGVHAGFDVQMGSLVVGVVGEYGRATLSDSVTAYSTTPASYTLTRRLRDNAGLRARAGVALGNTLVYGTGGGAWGKIRRSFTTSNTANAFTTNGNDNAWGWKAGGGIEQLIAPNFSIGAQYLYTSLKESDYVVGVSRGTAPATNPFLLVNSAGTDMRRSGTNFNSHVAQVTANFRF